jgi:hypothetical protein
MLGHSITCVITAEDKKLNLQGNAPFWLFVPKAESLEECAKGSFCWLAGTAFCDLLSTTIVKCQGYCVIHTHGWRPARRRV